MRSTARCARRWSRSIRTSQAVRLTDYKVRIIDSTTGTAARTRVLIESSDGTSTWATIGVNENIIEASLQALVDSLEYALLRKDFAAAVVEVGGPLQNKITIEEHFGLAETLRESAEYALPGQLNVFERRMLDVDGERLREMDAHGIAFAILSLNAPGVQSVHDRAKAIDLARRGNDALAAAVARHPDRYAGFAALPMQDPEAACEELSRAVKDLGSRARW